MGSVGGCLHCGLFPVQGWVAGGMHHPIRRVWLCATASVEPALAAESKASTAPSCPTAEAMAAVAATPSPCLNVEVHQWKIYTLALIAVAAAVVPGEHPEAIDSGIPLPLCTAAARTCAVSGANPQSSCPSLPSSPHHHRHRQSCR